MHDTNTKNTDISFRIIICEQKVITCCTDAGLYYHMKTEVMQQQEADRVYSKPIHEATEHTSERCRSHTYPATRKGRKAYGRIWSTYL